MVEERKNNVCVAVKRGGRIRWNCNVFNLAMEIVLKGLPDKSEINCPNIIHKTKALQMYTFLNQGRWNMCSCIHKNDAELFFNIWTPAHKVFRDRMTKKCMQFHVSSPKQTKCNTSELLASSPSEVVFSLGERREEFRMICIAH